MSLMVWDNETVLELIDLYRARPLLWDVNALDYRNRIKKQEAWREIGQAFGLERALAERKVRTLVGQYRRELAKAAATGAAPSRWFAFQRFSFLAGAQDDHSNASQSHHGNEEIKSEEEDNFDERTSSAGNDHGPGRKRPRLDWRPNKSEHSTHDLVALLCEEKRARDEFVVFGEHVAHKLRKVRDPQALSRAQYLINRILYNAESGKYDTPNGRILPRYSDATRPAAEASAKAWQEKQAEVSEGHGEEQQVFIKWETQSTTSLEDSMNSTNADLHN